MNEEIKLELKHVIENLEAASYEEGNNYIRSQAESLKKIYMKLFKVSFSSTENKTQSYLSETLLNLEEKDKITRQNITKNALLGLYTRFNTCLENLSDFAKRTKNRDVQTNLTHIIKEFSVGQQQMLAIVNGIKEDSDFILEEQSTLGQDSCNRIESALLGIYTHFKICFGSLSALAIALENTEEKEIFAEIIKSFSVWIQQLLAITKSSLEEKEFTETYLEDVDQDFTGEHGRL